MIYLVEPLCRDVSHEKVNAGLIAHLLEAFGAHSLVVVAERTHSHVLKQNLRAAGIDIDLVVWESLGVPATSGVLRVFLQVRLLARLLFRTRPGDSFFFSSFDYSLLAILAVASRVFGIRLSNLRLLCHGLLDELQVSHWRRNLPIAPKHLAKQGFLRKSKALLNRLVNGLGLGWKTIAVYWRYVFFPLSVCIRLAGPKVAQYLVLSKHIEDGIYAHKWAQQISVRSIDMPFLLAPSKPEDRGVAERMLRIAIVGNGSPSQLRRFLGELTLVVPNGGYEIQIVGMNTAGLDGLPHVRCLSPGVRMTRAAMDLAVSDVDFFLYLYDTKMFPFSCSGSFFEAYSYVKPVLCLETPCIDSYWDPSEPIGIRVATMGELALSIRQILLDPSSLERLRLLFVQNLQKRRSALLPVNQADLYRQLMK